MQIAQSELIVNNDGSIYHLNLKPEHIANTIITVGDPDRVDKITKYFDHIECSIRKREFHTQTGTYKNKRITVISTGIGTDNIDIVLNELDALVNINLETREIKEHHTSLNIIRIGTSGAIQQDIPVDSFLLSELAIGFDSLLHFYDSKEITFPKMSKALTNHLDWHPNKSQPYVVAADKQWIEHLSEDIIIKGVTATNVGFYGPQGRTLRLALSDEKQNEKIASFRYESKKITNLEMETAGIYGLTKLLGHHAVSLNAILANRSSGGFSTQPEKTIDALIRYALDKIVTFS